MEIVKSRTISFQCDDGQGFPHERRLREVSES